MLMEMVMVANFGTFSSCSRAEWCPSTVVALDIELALLFFHATAFLGAFGVDPRHGDAVAIAKHDRLDIRPMSTRNRTLSWRR
jgi:hypothetical protein